MTIEDLLSRLQLVRPDGAGWLALCPCHDDHSPSLKVDRGRVQPFVVCCRSCGARWPEIKKALGIELDAAPCYVRPPADDGEAARRTIIVEARTQRWNDPDVLIAYAGSDLHRALDRRIMDLHHAAEALGPEDPAAWVMLARAADLELDRRILEQVFDGHAG